MSYYVIKKEQMRKQCLACNGAGSKKSQMQGHKFVKTCAVCGGLGFNVTYRTTEVLLEVALREMASASAPLSDLSGETGGVV
jgi:hypothetical protein